MRCAFSLGMLAVFCAVWSGAQTTVGTNVGVAAPAAKTAVPANPAVDAEVEKEYKKLLADDDEAAAEVDKWIRDNEVFLSKGAGIPRDELNRRIHERFEPVQKAYEDFVNRHPDHPRARVAFGSFLGDLGDQRGAREQMERALTLDPKSPAAYNNLANIYAHDGELKKAFEYFSKAIELNPLEPTYYHNFGDTVSLFRKEAMEYYGIQEQEVFDKALGLYRSALRLDPENFPFATDLAATYYGIRPLRADEALGAWTNALRIAHDEIEREGVYVHLARIKFAAGRIAEARIHLAAVTNALYGELKTNLNHNIEARVKQSQQTNAASAAPKSP